MSGERRVALVTGAGSGIGRATARRLAADGDAVAICGRRPQPLEAVAGEIDGLAIVGDVATEEGAAAAVARTIEAFGRIDALVLNAGIVIAGSVAEISVEDWSETMRVNLTGPFLLARAALDELCRRQGSIVAVSSIGGLRAAPANAAYAAAKAGLAMLTQSMAVDFGPQGVRANCVAPGWVRTEMADAEMAEFGAPAGLSLEQSYEAVSAAVPSRRAADPEELAEAIAWLLSPAASFLNGAVIPVDGGAAVVDAGTLPFLPSS